MLHAPKEIQNQPKVATGNQNPKKTESTKNISPSDWFKLLLKKSTGTGAEIYQSCWKLRYMPKGSLDWIELSGTSSFCQKKTDISDIKPEINNHLWDHSCLKRQRLPEWDILDSCWFRRLQRFVFPVLQTLLPAAVSHLAIVTSAIGNHLHLHH